MHINHYTYSTCTFSTGIVPTFFCSHVQVLSHVTSLTTQSTLQDKDITCYLTDVLGHFHNHFSANAKTYSVSWELNLL